MSGRDIYRDRERPRRVRLSLPDDEYTPGDSSPRDADTDSQATSVVSYSTEGSLFSSQASGRRVHNIQVGRNRGSYSDEDLVSSLSEVTRSVYSDASYAGSRYAESSAGQSTTRSESTVHTEAPLRESRRQILDTSHREFRNVNPDELEYGEEPTSVAHSIQEAEFREIRERQKLPEPAARVREIPERLTRDEYKSYSKLLDEVHVPSEIREGLYVAKYVLHGLDTEI